MKTANNGKGRDIQSEAVTYFVRLTGGRSLPLEVISSLNPGRAEQVTLPPTVVEVPIRESQFEVLPDGALIDLVRERSGDLGFVVYQNGASTFYRTFQREDETLVPPRVHRSLADAMRLPRMLGTSETPRTLLREIDDVLCMYLDLDESDRKLVAYFALCTWLTDLQHIAPYLWIVGPMGSGKTTLLRLLSAICRRSIVAGNMSSAALYNLTTSLRPTLLLDEFEMAADAGSRTLQQLLRNGSSDGQRIFRGSRAYEVFGPKVIASRQGAADAALSRRGLVVAMRPRIQDLPNLDRDALAGIADRLQPKLLTFRLENYKRAKSVTLVSSSLTPCMLDIARALAVPLLGDPELERELLEIIAPHDAQAKTDRHGEPEWVVMTSLLKIIHIRGAGSALLTVKKLTASVEFQLEQTGESYRLKPRKVGEVLRSLGFPTQRLGCLGRGLRLSKTLIRSVHRAAKNLGICGADTIHPKDINDAFGGTYEQCEKDGFGGPCRDCEEAGLI